MFRISEANIEDIEVICDLRRAFLFFKNSLNPNADVSDKKLKSSDVLVKTYLSRKYSKMFIAFEDDLPIGFIHGTIDPKESTEMRGFIQDFFVIEKYRGKGVGSMLLQKIENWFINKGVLWGLLTDINNFSAIHFYEKKGYKKYNETDDLVFLKK